MAGIGLTGAVVAFVMKQNFDWRTCYFIGGGMGLLLLVLRISVFESGMFHHAKQQEVQRGNLLMFFTNRDRLKKICAQYINRTTYLVCDWGAGRILKRLWQTFRY
ncbi:MAG: hypothetical protein NVV59_13440 [Chitinophagaceae bacterium]|nr:hypothetical protein [Chitinophagaceae bacterium]